MARMLEQVTEEVLAGVIERVQARQIDPNSAVREILDGYFQPLADSAR